MGILQKARLLSSNETCRCSERIAFFVGVSSTHPLKIYLPSKNFIVITNQKFQIVCRIILLSWYTNHLQLVELCCSIIDIIDSVRANTHQYTNYGFGWIRINLVLHVEYGYCTSLTDNIRSTQIHTQYTGEYSPVY